MTKRQNLELCGFQCKIAQRSTFQHGKIIQEMSRESLDGERGSGKGTQTRMRC